MRHSCRHECTSNKIYGSQIDATQKETTICTFGRFTMVLGGNQDLHNAARHGETVMPDTPYKNTRHEGTANRELQTFHFQNRHNQMHLA